MVQEYSFINKATTAIGYSLAGAVFLGFCYLYGNAMEEGRDNCRFITMNPAVLVCDEKKEATMNQRTSSETIDKILTE